MVPKGVVPGNVVAAEATADGPRHDVAVISLDFDPPLRVLQIDQARSSAALLAAIDNKGTYTEQQLAVTVSLRSTPDDELLAQQREVVASLAPGQATIVRFSGFTSIPARSGYVLTVMVEPVPGEQNLANNTKTVPLLLVMSQ